MGKVIKVEAEQLEQAAKSIENLAADYKAQYMALYSETSAMSSTWKGEGNIAFTDQIEGFKPDFEKMKDYLDQYSSYLRIAAKAYKDTQTSVVSSARKLIN